MTGKHYKKTMDGVSVYKKPSPSRTKDYSSKHGRVKKKLSPWKKALLTIVCVFLCVLLAAGGLAAWYAYKLNSALSMDSETSAEMSKVLSPAQKGEASYILVLGSDSREGSGTSTSPAYVNGNERSDVMMLVRVDLPRKQLTLVSIPRDTRWLTPQGDVAKINEAYNIGGPAMTVQAVENLTGVDISNYVEVHFSGFEAIVDQLGGIEVDVKTEIQYKDALTGEIITVKEGKQIINGQQAQILARARHEYATGQDATRQSNVRMIFQAIIKTILQKPYFELPQTVLSLASYVSTDINSFDLLSMAKSLVAGSGNLVIYSCTGPTDGEEDEAAGGLWLCYDNPQGWEYLMSVVDSGADPSGVDVEGMANVPES